MGFPFTIVSSLLCITCIVSRVAGGNISVSQTQSQALYDWYIATGMDHLSTNWFDDSSRNDDYYYCDFLGVTCDNEGYVRAITLNNSGLVGTLPDLRLLNRFQRLQASGNFLQATLPDSLVGMVSLQVIYLGGNYFTGSLPEFSTASALRRIFLARNSLTGTIPASICDAHNLTALDLSHNFGVKGTLPNCFSRLESISSLRISGTTLTGTIPNSLCGVRNMNGLNPNTFGCDGIGCGKGYHQRFSGRQNSTDLPCVKCQVPSNVIGSARCRWYEFEDDYERNKTLFPSASINPSTVPSLAKSMSPVEEKSSYQPTQASISTSTPTSPSNQVPPIVDDETESKSGKYQFRSIVIATIFVGIAFVGVTCSILYQFTQKHKRNLVIVESQDSSTMSAKSDEIVTQQLSSGTEVLEKNQFHMNHVNSNYFGSGLSSDASTIRSSTRHQGNASILRSSSVKNDWSELNFSSSGPAPPSSFRKVRFNLQVVPSISSEAIDRLNFLSTDSPIEERDMILCQQQHSSHIDNESWAAWILQSPSMHGAKHSLEPNPQLTNVSNTISIVNVDQAPPVSPYSSSRPLLSKEESSLDWERFGTTSSRILGGCHMFPYGSNNALFQSSSEGCSPLGKGKSALVGALRCGWLKDDDLDSVDVLSYSTSGDSGRAMVADSLSDAEGIEEGHVEI